jgi:predicted small integral membrane protein
VVVCLVFLWMAKVAHAQSSIGVDWDQFIVGTGVGKFQGNGGEEIALNAIQRAITLVKYAMGAVALVFGILYAMNLIFARGSEDTIGKQKKNFLWAFIGFVILMAASGVAEIFKPQDATPDQLIDFDAARSQTLNLVTYMKWMLGSVIVMLMTLSGIKMIMAQGDEAKITEQKKNLVWSGIGMLVILLAGNLVNAFYVVKDSVASPADPSKAALELGGVISLILVFLGPVAVLFTIYAGALYLTALDDEDRTKKAKSMIIGGVMGIVIIYSAYALVNTFFPGFEAIAK